MSNIRLLKGDCLQKLKELEDNSIDSVVTDPPYGIGFMNKEWDSPKKHRELVEREQKRSEKRHKEGKSPAKGTFSKGVQPGLPIGGAKEGKWFEEWTEQWAKEAYRVLKPGGYVLSFCAPRMYHRMASGIEDAGFQIRDQIMWVFGSGFPKSHNIGKAVDKLQGNEREVVGTKIHSQKGVKVAEERTTIGAGAFGEPREADITKGNSPYEGWGTALKPAHEPIVMARKPFKGSVAQNVLEWGTGGINIDESRIEYVSDYDKKHQEDIRKGTGTFFGGNGVSKSEQVDMQGRFPANFIIECTCENPQTAPAPKSGHWPKGKTKGFGEFGGGESSYEGVGPKEDGTMVIHTDPNCPCRILDEQSGTTKSSKRGAHNNKKTEHTNTYTPPEAIYGDHNTYGDTGGASRFFYCPKASKKDRNEGLDIVEQKNNRPIGTAFTKDDNLFDQKVNNFHPTVKPTDLMAYLVRMVTPKGGVVLDPFMGSGSTGKASVREGFNFVGIEREDEYIEIAKTRIEHEQGKHKHREFFDEV
jgi:site-specific DNA-methyltransferase (adenine-specific)